MTSSQFISIGSETNFHISVFCPVAPAEELIYKDDVVMQLLDKQGKQVESYTWDPSISAWVDFKTGALIDKTFYAGDAFWVSCPVAGFKLQSKGTVGIKERNMPLIEGGFMALGNPFPIDLNIQEVSAFNVDNELYKDDIIIQVLDSNGKKAASYTYDPDTEGGKWVDFVTGEKADFIVKAGDAFWVTAGYSGMSIQFPAPEL